MHTVDLTEDERHESSSPRTQRRFDARLALGKRHCMCTLFSNARMLAHQGQSPEPLVLLEERNAEQRRTAMALAPPFAVFQPLNTGITVYQIEQRVREYAFLA